MKYTDRETAGFADMMICILSPMAHVEPAWVRSTVNMVAYSWAHGLPIFEMGHVHRQVVHWGRNELARQALESNGPAGPYTHFLWLDTDHVFEPYLAAFLARHMVNRSEIDAVSALYYARESKH